MLRDGVGDWIQRKGKWWNGKSSPPPSKSFPTIPGVGGGTPYTDFAAVPPFWDSPQDHEILFFKLDFSQLFPRMLLHGSKNTGFCPKFPEIRDFVNYILKISSVFYRTSSKLRSWSLMSTHVHSCTLMPVHVRSCPLCSP